MKNFWKISVFLHLLIVSSFGKALNVVTTDTQMMHILQKQSAIISTKQALHTTISFIQERKATRYLQLGNPGDIMVTSNIKLCKDLAAKGLSGYQYSVIVSESIYCTNFPIYKSERIFTLLPGEYTNLAKENIEKISHNIGSSIYFLTKDDNVYEQITARLKTGVNICGFASLFQDINFDKKALINTGENLKYYACPLIGLNGNAHSILIKYFNEKKYN